jgi:multisubunit Na+/H+ antiporter MnhE subunit
MVRRSFDRFVWTWLSLAGLISSLWLIVTQAAIDLLGLLFIAGVTSLAVLIGWPALSMPILRRLPRFLVYYLPQMFWGALNVASLACRPKLQIQPQWQPYQANSSTLQHPKALILLSSCICLIPGTLAIVDDTGGLQVHVLDHRSAWLPQVQQLERQILRLLMGSMP